MEYDWLKARKPVDEARKKRAYESGRDPRREEEHLVLYRQAVVRIPAGRSHEIRRAKIDRYILEHYRITAEPDDWLVGRMTHGYDLTEREREEQDFAEAVLKNGGDLSCTQTAWTGHRVVDYEKLLQLGISGILEEIAARETEITYTDSEAVRKKAVYSAMRISLEGLAAFAERTRAALLEMAERSGDERTRTRFTLLADNLRTAPWEPCRHFHEAVQVMWLTQFALTIAWDTSLTGNLDDYLWPYYKADLDAGLITRDRAMDILEDLYLKHNELYDAWPASVMLGGRNRKGEPICNELTWMGIEAIRTTGLINPSVSLAYTEAVPDELLLRCVELVGMGLTRPSIFNDRIVSEGLRKAGVSEEDSRRYCHSTCVEITPIAASNILVATPYVNLCKAFEYILSERKRPYVIGAVPRVTPGSGGVEGEPYLAHPVEVDLDALDTFDKFYALMKKVLAEIIEAHVISALELARSRAMYQASPLSSALLNDCIARGRDSAAGGARYSFIYPNFPGFVNLVDSLAAIRKTVYEEGTVTLRELGRLCENDFENAEAFRQTLVNRCPKFGNNDDGADGLAADLFRFIYDRLRAYRECSGGACYPSYFAYIVHGLMGEITDATPDGRRAGTALSEHLGAFTGMDKKGPVAVMRSIAKVDQRDGIGGIATNYRFAKPFITGEKGKRAVADFIRAFMAAGCFEIQFNVVDRETLLAARSEPEKYRTLLVRVAGYSDYFVNLRESIQNEIIARTENGGV